MAPAAQYRQKLSRHYCEVCRTWTQGDPVSVRVHARGNRHARAVREKEQATAAARSAAERGQREVDRELAAIDRAARAALGLAPAAATGPAPAREAPRQARQGAAPARGEAAEEAPEEDGDEDSPFALLSGEQVLGQYEIDGVVYLEGRLHHDLLQVGRRCEAIVLEKPAPRAADRGEGGSAEALEQPEPAAEEHEEAAAAGDEAEEEVWRQAEVVEAANMAGGKPQRRLTLRFLPDGPTCVVPAKDIRIVAPPPPPIPPPVARGEWSVVSVRVVTDEGAPAAAPAAEPRPPQPQTISWGGHAPAPAPPKLQVRELPGAGDEDALGTFNPFGGAYKGFELGLRSAAEQAKATLAQEAAPPVRPLAEDEGASSSGGSLFRRKKKPRVGEDGQEAS
jgi:hypothetical protein